ncbi:MAG: glutamate-1-semialdehyde-2,1-aminomutase [Deltaproteobacteria bacterium]|nr:MAG: glutamate-1-semialdehyde-2,1-aminomutase [Deltaproteobacteria bacterium]
MHPLIRSREIMEEARRLMPGGVNSPVRAFKAVGGDPPVIARAGGAWIEDVDGNRYVDYVATWGPAILGHAPKAVVEAIVEAAAEGTSFGAPSPREVELARLVIEAVPTVEKIRFVNSGTEATMSALRLARAYTGRDEIVKFEGCYHGHADSLLVRAGSGVETLGLPDSPGVPADFARHTLTLPYNDLEAAERLFAERGETIACVIIEPIAGNMGCVLPEEGYLQGLQALCRAHGALFVLDEVMTGFRVHRGGAAALFGLEPDLSCFGKIIGGGLPVGAYGGRAEILSQVAPEGPVYQAGTLSGNPLAMAAGAATLRALSDEAVYERLEATAARLAEGIAEAAREAGVPILQTRVGSMMGLFFTEQEEIRNLEDVRRCDFERFARWHQGMLRRGVYLAPSQYEAGFVSLAHDDEAIEHTLRAARETLAEIA